MQVLLISYTFPPYPGIGGRRWTKIAKYLTKLGCTVHVVHAKNPFLEESIWVNDINGNENIVPYSFKSGYPTILMKKPNTVFQKFHYRLSLFYVNLFSKGTPYDRAIFDRKKIIKLSEEIIYKFQIQNVIVTSAPFSLSYFSLELKKKFKSLNLMIDFRDPWTWGSLYGFSELKNNRITFEKEMEKNVIENASIVFVPVNVMRDKLTKLYPNFESKIKILRHSFDADEIVVNKNSNQTMVVITFYGTLYEEIGNYFKLLAKDLSSKKDKIEFHIYSDSTKYIDLFEEHGLINNNVFYHGILPTIELFEKISTSNFVLLVHPKRGVDNISTKFYEIIYSRTPILYVGEEGKTSEFITSNKVGYTFTEKKFADTFLSVVLGNIPYSYNSTFAVDSFSFENTSKLLIDNYFIL